MSLDGTYSVGPNRYSYLEHQHLVRVLCYERRSVGQIVLVSGTHLGLRFLLVSDSCGFVSFTIAADPRQHSHSRVTIFYCLRVENSLFVASYDSQAQGGGIRPHLHTLFGTSTKKTMI
jgi:hypothetical protein